MNAIDTVKQIKDPKTKYMPTVQETATGSIVIHKDSYEPAYCEAAIIVLSEPCKSIIHFALAIGFSRVTVISWMKKHPEFREAVLTGLENGKAAFIDKMAKHAFEPSKDVNNGLIKILGMNLYGINGDEAPTVIINNNGQNLAEGETGRLYTSALEEEDSEGETEYDDVEIFAEKED